MRVYGSFAALILVFALLLGFVFIRLYTNSTTAYYEEQLTKVASNVSENLRNWILEEDYEEALSYIEIVRELENADIWTIANAAAAHPMDSDLVSVTLTERDFDYKTEFSQLLTSAFAGESRAHTFYSEPHEATAMAVGMPIMGLNKEICGAVLISVPMKELDATIDSAKSMIGLSAAIALVISFAPAMVFAGRITAPVRVMREMTREMTEGNYKVKTGIRRHDELGEMARSIDMLSDKLLENEEERKNLEQMRLDFFANVSHELRTPISVVRGRTESLIDGVITEEDKIRQYYESILRECKGMERLVGDLLTLSKMQNPNFQIEKEPVNLVHVIDDVVKSAATISAEKSISVAFKRAGDVYMVMGDYDRLRQMFLVIFDNAVKFSPVGSTIHVTIESLDKLRVSIRDEGIGISAEELPQIFDKFYRSKLRQNAKGTGLGLAIAKYIALKHEGEISVKSEVGKGTEFIFTFTEVHEGDVPE